MELVPPNGNQAHVQPIEIHLDGCGVEVLEATREDGSVYRQLRATHLSGAAVFVLTFSERYAVSIGNKLTGSKLVIADAINDDTAA